MFKILYFSLILVINSFTFFDVFFTLFIQLIPQFDYPLPQRVREQGDVFLFVKRIVGEVRRLHRRADDDPRARFATILSVCINGYHGNIRRKGEVRRAGLEFKRSLFLRTRDTALGKGADHAALFEDFFGFI